VRADEVKLESGSLNFLKGETAICVRYIYDGMRVDDKAEADFISFQMGEQNKGGPGKGDEWLSHWKNDRASRYQPLFEDRINKEVSKRSVHFASNESQTRYTLIVKILSIHPGWAGWGLIHDSSKIDAWASFVETARPGSALAVVGLRSVGGNGFDYNVFGRVADAFGNCGKRLGQFLMDKKVFKK